MGLNTENASALIGTSAPHGGAHTVEMLVGTYVESVGRDVKKGEVVTVNDKDYRFLKPYEYCKDVDGATAPETDDTEDGGADGENDANENATGAEGDKSKDEAPQAPATPQVEGKRRNK